MSKKYKYNQENQEVKLGETDTHYFIKLINDEKFEVSLTEWNEWVNWKAGDILTITSKNGNALFIPKRNIVLGYTLNI